MNAAEVVLLGQELGLDAVGITRAEAYRESAGGEACSRG